MSVATCYKSAFVFALCALILCSLFAVAVRADQTCPVCRDGRYCFTTINPDDDNDAMG